MSMRLGLGLGQASRGWGASPWTPASLFAASEEGAWYDPSDPSTVWQDDAGTVAGAIDSPVGRLDDKSGNGNHLTQGTAGARPILRSDGTLYWLERDGSDDFLASAGSLTLEAGWTLGAAGSFTAGSDTTTASMFGIERAGTAFFYVGLRQNIARARSALRGGTIADPTVAQTLAETASDAYPAGTPAVLVSQFQALSHDIRLNGTTRDTKATTWNAQTIPDSWLVFGRQEISPVVPMNMYAAAAFKRLPSTAELANLEAWLAAKAGVTL
jgi:hypothetical protein